MALCPLARLQGLRGSSITGNKILLSPTGPSALQIFALECRKTTRSFVPSKLTSFPFWKVCYSIPNLFHPLDTSAWIPPASSPTFNLALATGGAGTQMIGFLDAGIDCTNRLFRNPSSTTRILRIRIRPCRRTRDDFPQRARLFSLRRSVLRQPNSPKSRSMKRTGLQTSASWSPPRDTSGHGTFVARLPQNAAGQTPSTEAAPSAT